MAHTLLSNRSIWSATESGGIDLAVKSDLFMVQMQSDEVAGLPEVEADARRVRLLVEGSRAMPLSTEAQVTTKRPHAAGRTENKT